MIKKIVFRNEKLNYFKNKPQLCDPFDVKLRDRSIDPVFACNHNPSARLIASLNHFKRAQTVFIHLKDGAY